MITVFEFLYIILLHILSLKITIHDFNLIFDSETPDDLNIPGILSCFIVFSTLFSNNTHCKRIWKFAELIYRIRPLVWLVWKVGRDVTLNELSTFAFSLYGESSPWGGLTSPPSSSIIYSSAITNWEHAIHMGDSSLHSSFEHWERWSDE